MFSYFETTFNRKRQYIYESVGISELTGNPTLGRQIGLHHCTGGAISRMKARIEEATATLQGPVTVLVPKPVSFLIGLAHATGEEIGRTRTSDCLGAYIRC